MKAGFLEKLLERFDKLDPESIQTHFVRLVQEKGLLETIFQSIQEGVVVADNEGRMTYANRAAETLLGFTLASMRGRSAEQALRELDWKRILNVDASEWSKIVSGEIEITYPAHRYVAFYGVPLAGEGTGSEGAVIILRDITHAREQEADMVQSERLHAVTLLAAGVAHEIGNPLNALTIHLQLLEREIRKLDGDQRQTLGELADIAGKEVARLDVIITQFLKAIRPNPPKLAPARIDHVIRDTLLLMRQEIENRGIKVQVEPCVSLPRINVDRDQLKQAFFNIIKNAIHAMAGDGTLVIRLETTDRYVSIAFEDSGKGIDPEDLGRIFEPYHTTKQEGSGLGLMIVQRIVQDHGGQIEVESRLGEGTRITVLLPIADRRMRLLTAPDQAVSTTDREIPIEGDDDETTSTMKRRP